MYSEKDAENLFINGRFNEAKKFYLKILSNDPENFDANFYLGYIEFLSNNLNKAKFFLKNSIRLKPDMISPKILLGYTFYRQDRFQEAAIIFHEIGEENFAEKLEKIPSPYRIENGFEKVYIDFITIDPLPLVHVKVNENREANFLIDTGAGETVLDQKFAEEVDVTIFKSKDEDRKYGYMNSLMLNDITIENIPIQIDNVRQYFKPIFRDIRVDGVIGTMFLYHFTSTIDYLNGRLILQRKENFIEKYDGVPFWMAGDHFIIAWGKVNGKPYLLCVDTGLAGGGFVCSKSTIKEVGISLLDYEENRIIPFIVNRLALGGFEEQNIFGMCMNVFPIENMFGFRIGGIVSHQFFRNYSLTLDFTNMKLFLEKISMV